MIRCELQNGKTKGNKSGVPRNKMLIHEKEGKRETKKIEKNDLLAMREIAQMVEWTPNNWKVPNSNPG